MTNLPTEMRSPLPRYARVGVHMYLLVFAFGSLLAAIMFFKDAIGLKGWMFAGAALVWLFLGSIHFLVQAHSGPGKWDYRDERYRAALFLNGFFALIAFAFIPSPFGWLFLTAGIYCMAVWVLLTRRIKRDTMISHA